MSDIWFQSVTPTPSIAFILSPGSMPALQAGRPSDTCAMVAAMGLANPVSTLPSGPASAKSVRVRVSLPVLTLNSSSESGFE